jgi:hypothetical protein
MALSNQALTTVSAVQGEIEVSNESRVERLIESVSEAMSSVAGSRVWYYSASHTQRVKAFGNSKIFLSTAPVLAVTSVEQLDVTGNVVRTFGASEYGISGGGTTGVLESVDGQWPWTGTAVEGYSRFRSDPSVAPLLRVVYEGGWVTPWQVDTKNSANLLGSQTRTLPFALEDACIREVVSRLKGQGRDLTIDTQTAEASVTTFRRTGKHTRGLSEETYNVARRFWLGGR